MPDVTNRDRADWARQALDHFPAADNDDLTNIADLIVDLLHLVRLDFNPGGSIEGWLAARYAMFEEETAEDEDGMVEDDLPEWTPEDSQRAEAQGWNVFAAEGSIQNDDGRSPYQLQRVDEQGTFKNDSCAWEMVVERAWQGNPLHIRALKFIKARSPGEFDLICVAHPTIKEMPL